MIFYMDLYCFIYEKLALHFFTFVKITRIFILKYMKDTTRATKHILKFANQVKQDLLEQFYIDFSEALQICIDLLYEEKLPLKALLSSKELPEYLGKIKHSRWKQVIYKQASEIIRGTIKADEYQKRERYKKVYHYFAEKNRQLKFLENHFHELNLKKYTKPVIKHAKIVIDERFLNEESGNSFDMFIKLFLPYFKEGKRRAETINLPVKLTRMDEKYKDWTRKKSILLEKINGQFYIDFIYEKPLPEKKTDGITIAVDFGEKKLLVTSREEYIGTEIEAICNEINNCKQRSEHYYQLIRKRNQYIDESVKSLDLTNVAKIVVEDLKDLKKRTCRRRKSTKSHRKTFRFVSQERTFLRLESLCEEHGIELVKVSPAYTSQTCSRCGTVDKSQRNGEIYHCKTCGTIIDADFNASLNILHRGVYSPSNTGKLEI